MTLTFNSEKYDELLSQYQPKRIRTEVENERALAMIESLMHRDDCTPEEDEMCDLLMLLVETFEAEYYQPGSAVTPHGMVEFLMEQQGLTVADLAAALGSEAIAIAILAGQHDLSIPQVKALSHLFKVDPRVFI
jgi:HTH-type transcriptional regulator/antitoxin HigA